ncbi:MAG: S8 family serine peptidase [Clostridiales bacterium]|nr:S8 family serine peptidase [Clostridiales bacterium]
MPNEKIENQLNLALDATAEEREKSLDLDVGYETVAKTWEVIVKFSGTTEELERVLKESFPNDYLQIRLTNLSNEYAILVLPEAIVEKVAALPEIEYMEKPKRLFFAVNNGKRASCISALQTGEASVSDRNRLFGNGVIVAVVDSGIDYSHPDFRNADGTTRILDLWDQTVPGGSVPDRRNVQGEEEQYLQPPEGFFLGTEFPREIINLALEQPTEQQRYEICPSRDNSGHGTHVAGIAAGNGRASEGRYRGVAFESELIVVKLGVQKEEGFPRTTELMQAVDYCIRKAQSYGRPIALNLSFGNNYGSHSGTSLIETFLDDMADRWKTSIAIGSGNEGAAAVHTSGRLVDGRTEEVELAVSEYEIGINLQIWKSYVDEVSVSIVHPNGTVIGPIRKVQGTQRFAIQNTQILLYYGEPSPYRQYQEIYFDFIPKDNYIDSGIWKIRLLPQRIVQGNYDMWLPSGGVLNAGTGFLFPTEETTLTIPSTASKVITVAAYDALYNQLASFSGRGYTRETNQIKPDIAAPGVEITSCAPGGGYVTRSGTSMATPFVTGGAALLMEWGIVNGNDAYLYGERMKAYFIRGARHLPVLSVYPNPQLGWGVLCVAASIPV